MSYEAPLNEECGKLEYPNRELAMEALIEVRGHRPPQERKERAINECPTCGGWHLTSNIQKEIDNNAPEVRASIIRTKRQMEERKRMKGLKA